MSSYVTMGQFTEGLLALYDHINERITVMEASEQGQVDALTAQIGTVATDLTATSTKIQTELDALEAQIAAGVQPDLTALTAAVAPLDSAVQALGALAPTPPVPPTPAA